MLNGVGQVWFRYNAKYNCASNSSKHIILKGFEGLIGSGKEDLIGASTYPWVILPHLRSGTLPIFSNPRTLTLFPALPSGSRDSLLSPPVNVCSHPSSRCQVPTRTTRSAVATH